MTEPQKYRKKPVEIEAMEWSVEGGATPIIDWILREGGRATYQCESLRCTSRPEDHSILIRTLEGDMKASFGDFVIRGTKGEFYPCKPDIFRNLHEMPDEGAEETVRPFTIDTLSGRWLEPVTPLTYEQGIRIAASVLPDVSMEQLALWVDEQKFDQGPGQ